MKTLVAYYSNSGTTMVVAERIAVLLGAELDAIEESKPRPALLVNGKKSEAGGGAIVRAVFSAMLGMGSTIKESPKALAGYDLVVVGSPVWAGSLAPAVRSYLKRHRSELGRVAFFCTAGDPSKHRTFKQMRNVTGKEPVATLAVKSDDAKSDACARALSGFVASLKTGS